MHPRFPALFPLSLQTLILGAFFLSLVPGGADAQPMADAALVLRLEANPEAVEDRVTEAGDQAQHWRNRLRAYGYRAEIGTGASLNENVYSYDVVVLPGASRPLFAEERNLLLDFTAAGGSLILTQTAGLNAERAAGSASLASELGLRYRRDLYDETNSWLVVLDKPSLLSARIARMQNLAVQASRPVFIESAIEPTAFWLDQRVSPPDFKAASEQTAMTYGIYGSGRFFWMGFPIDGVGGDLESSEAFHRLMGNLIDFFDAMPVAELAPWPYPHKTTAIFSMDVEQQFGNIRRVFSLPNLPPFTHFILTNQGELYAETLGEIADYARADQEIALHGNDHDVFRGQPADVQYARFKEAKEAITRVTGTPPSGFRPPEEAYDFFTVRALLKNGYTYMLADHSPRAPVPKLSREWAQPSVVKDFDEILVQFNIHNKDDVKVVIGNDRPSPEQTFRFYKDDFEQIRLREGLYIANVHSHLLASERYIGVFERVIDHVASHDPWLANCRQVADWWRDRERIVVTHFRRDSHNVIFGIENNSGGPVEGLTVDIWMPYSPAAVEVESRPNLAARSKYQLEGNRMRLQVEPLKTDAVREYHVSWRASN